jgi:hypothetical protein
MGTGLIINGKQVLVPGLDISNWKDNPKLRRSKEDGAARDGKWVHQVILHTTKGIPGGSDKRPQFIIAEKAPPSQKDIDVAAYWSTSDLQSGAHIIIDRDGSVVCIADLATEAMYHAAQRDVNHSSIGIEIFQESNAGIYKEALDAAVKLCDFLAVYFGIQRQIHWPYKSGPVQRLAAGGKDCVGFFGHRDVSNNRGLGDPGNIIMELLITGGYEVFDFSKNEDLVAWKTRQSGMNISADGIAGPGTKKALLARDYVDGIWTYGKKIVGPAETPPSPPAVPVPPPIVVDVPPIVIPTVPPVVIDIPPIAVPAPEGPPDIIVVPTVPIEPPIVNKEDNWFVKLLRKLFHL